MSGVIRFVNRSTTVWRGSTPRGGRIALAPGEFATDPYFGRFARLHSERNDGKKPLVQEYEDGTPVGVDLLPENNGIVAPVIPRRIPAAPVPLPPTGCETGCEAACQFPAETAVSTVSDINASMDRTSGPPPLPDTPFVSPAASMLPVEHKMEPGIAPPMPTFTKAAAPPPSTPAAAAPPPQLNEGILNARTEHQAEEVMSHFGLTEQQVLEVNAGYMKVILDGDETYVSRYDMGWKTKHLPSMKAHVTTNKSGV